MTTPAEKLALEQTHALCNDHLDALRDAMGDMQKEAFGLSDYQQLSKADRRLLDQFAYRFTRLQDDMGARLMPAILRALGEDVAAMPALDRFSRLEQLGWLPSAEHWNRLRQIRNQFAHDYPATVSERFERLQSAVGAANQMAAILEQFNREIDKRFPGSSAPPR